MNKFFIFLLSMSFALTSKAQTANISILNPTVSGTTLEFDVYLSAVSGTIYLGNSDLKFSYTAANFTSATFTRVSGSSALKNEAGTTVSYVMGVTIASNLLTINIQSPSPIVEDPITPYSDFDTRVAKITSTPTKIGRFRLITISNSAGVAGIACSSPIIATIARDASTISEFQESKVQLAADPNGCTIPSPITLPIDVLSFEAQAQNGKADLTWRVANEQNMSGYEIEKSQDGMDFTPLSKTTAKNATTATYATIDAEPHKPVSYYRLKIVENNGRFTYSAIKSISFDKNQTAYKIYPNPSSDIINIKFNAQIAQSVDFELFNTVGQLVYSYKLEGKQGNNHFYFKTHHLPKGLYSLRIKQGNLVSVEKVMIE